MRLVWIVVDALGNHQMSPQRTPRLWRLAAEGGRAPGGGLAELPAHTYPNFATFVTGASWPGHGIVTNHVHDGSRWCSAERVGPRVPTVFDAAAALGCRSAVVVGDQNLVGVCGARAAEEHWPPDGVLPEGTPLDATGYGAAEAVVAAAASLGAGDADFAFVQIDDVDAARHVHGAESAAALAAVESADAAVAAVLDLWAPVWHDTVAVVLSDHDQEEVVGADPRPAEALADLGTLHRLDGTAAWVAPGPARADLAAVVGIEGMVAHPDGSFTLWAGPGRVLGLDWGQGGDHGSPRTRTQVAVVGGGHPAARALGRIVGARMPLARQWAGWLGDLMGWAT